MAGVADVVNVADMVDVADVVDPADVAGVAKVADMANRSEFPSSAFSSPVSCKSHDYQPCLNRERLTDINTRKPMILWV